MKTVAVYYSYTGHTKALAAQKAKELDADLIEVKEKKHRSTPGAYILGSFAAMRHKPDKLVDFHPNLTGYDRIVIMAPIWAGSPAPAFNNIVDALPSGKKVDLVLTSGSGSSGKSAVHSKSLVQ